MADLDPLKLRPQKEVTDLNLDFHNLSQPDLDSYFSISNFQNSENLKLSKYLLQLKNPIPRP